MRFLESLKCIANKLFSYGGPPLAEPKHGYVRKTLWISWRRWLDYIWRREGEGDNCVAVSADCQSECSKYEKKNEKEKCKGGFRIEFKFISST